MNLLGLYLQDFNREYLSSPADRRQVGQTLAAAVLSAALFCAAAVALWGL